MKQVATVKNIVEVYQKGGIYAVKAFLSEAEVYEMTWSAKLKKMLDDELVASVKEEIELVAFNIKMNFNGKNGNSCGCK
jgi:hypothetical protein